jgi:hypothetical protein
MSGRGPAFRIPSHVAAYSLLFAPAFLFWAYYDKYNKPEELEETLKENYKDHIRRSQAGNKHMAEFFDHAIRNKDGSVDSQLDSVYKAGKGEMKRHYAVDKKLYGTAEGVAERKKVYAEMNEQKRQMKEKKRQRAAGITAGDDGKKKKENATTPETETPVDAEPKAVARKTIEVDATQLVAVTVLAGAAALVGFLAGGSRRS